MSINITVRPNGATTGGTNQTIPGDGEIDTKEEIEAALTHLPEGSTNAVVVGNRPYTRAQLVEMRSRLAAPAASATPPTSSTPPTSTTPPPASATATAATATAAAPADSGDTVAGDGVSHGFYLNGRYYGGLGDQGHSGGGLGAGYSMGVTLKPDGTQVFLDPGLGLVFGHQSSSYTTPGGEPVSSAFTNYGGEIKAHLRVVPNIWERRLAIGGGPSLGIGGFSTADSKTVSTPGNCTPGDFGRQDCEPTAGSQTGNDGTQGLMNFRTGSARGTSGLFLTPGFDLNVGVDIVRGDWGKLAGVGTMNISQMVLAPSDGDGFSFTQLAGMLGIRGDFGGGAVPKAPAAPTAVAAPTPAAPPKPDDDGDGVPNDVDACPNEPGVKSTDPKKNGCPAFKVTWTVLQTYPAGARPAINDIVMVGQDKLEGVTYYIEAFDSTTKKLLGTLDSKTINDSITLEKGKPQFLAFVSPEKGGLFKRQNNYFVTLMDKDGKPLTERKGFTVAETVAGKPAPRGRGMQ